MYTEFKLSRIYGQGRADDIPRHVHPLVDRGNTLVLESFYVNSISTNKGQWYSSSYPSFLRNLKP